MANHRISDIRFCFVCNISKSVDNRGYSNWRRQDHEWFCKRCHTKYFHNPFRDHSLWNRRKLIYKGNQIYVKENPRKGICLYCGKKAKRTETHHFEYHDDDPLKDTIELCGSCHRKEGWRTGVYTKMPIDSKGRFISRVAEMKRMCKTS